ncbi:hypothetical protein BDDG_06447 [Blastomyces dermatitidis ATCC 18188]|nr:hypothetical protein BDDG_06447 [Blastomyces dermatitidis ATCC 18188]EQL36764.1 hypothetical protein BDFG_01729 [Blastomyces dermatitidis ATCC 26199]
MPTRLETGYSDFTLRSVVLQPSLVWDPLSGRDKRNLYCVDLDFDAVEFSTPALCRGMRGPSRLRDMG